MVLPLLVHFSNYANNYARLKCRNYASTFYCKFGENTSELSNMYKQVNGEHFYRIYNRRLY